MNKNFEERKACEACGKDDIEIFSISANPITLEKLETYEFKVTNKDYGRAIETIRCRNCHLIQPKYILDSKDILKFYSDIQDYAYLDSASTRGTSNLEQVNKLIKKNIQGVKSIIEIGAGSGTMVALLKNRYEHVDGVEPNKNFCDYAKKAYGISLVCLGYEQLSDKQKYDVVLALDVIEHVVSPNDFMKKISNLLNPGGIAVIGTPDVSSFSSKVLGKKWYHIRPMHLFYFTPKSFREISKLNNLKVIQEKYFSWTLPTDYVLDSLQKLLFKKSLIKIKVPLMRNIRVNFFDSKVYVVKKMNEI